MDDNFDKLSNKLREADGVYIETPTVEAWKRLEKKLVVERKRRGKNSLLSPPAYVTTIILLLLCCVTAAWFIIHDKEIREKATREFAELKNLEGVWECRDGKTIDVIHWHLINDSCLQATKFIFFDNEKNNLAEEKFSITHAEENNFLFFEKNNFISENNFFQKNIFEKNFEKNNSGNKNENTFSKKFIFKSKDKKEIEILMDSTNKNFSLKVDAGVLFLYRSVR